MKIEKKYQKVRKKLADEKFPGKWQELSKETQLQYDRFMAEIPDIEETRSCSPTLVRSEDYSLQERLQLKETIFIDHPGKGTMIRVCIVEDNDADEKALADLLRRLGQEEGQEIGIDRFADACSFLCAWKPIYDIVFMDIDLPDIDGMTASTRLRELDSDVCLVITTYLSDMAVTGYKVHALDFLIKPVQYYSLRTSFQLAMRYIADNRTANIAVKTTGGLQFLDVRQILYVEVSYHKVTCHTTTGNIETWSSLQEIEKKITPYGFIRCSRSCLINLRYIRRIDRDDVVIADQENGRPIDKIIRITQQKYALLRQRIIERQQH